MAGAVIDPSIDPGAAKMSAGSKACPVVITFDAFLASF
jgi:hypothetical protein